MVNPPMLLVFLWSWLFAGEPGAAPMPAPLPVMAEDAARAEALELYHEVGLSGEVATEVFVKAYARVSGMAPARMLAIADMTQPSTAKRLYIIDLDRKTLMLRTWVAHGQGTGEVMARHFSNSHGSHQTSLGLYRVGAEIVSPKHGPALLLHGMDKGTNDQALAREVIMHGADYVSASFIAQHGRLGRSWGCPAVSREHMAKMIELLADGGLLYVHGN